MAKIGWLEKGGNRIGIWTEAGAYFYYAHLDSYANLKVGDQVKAGHCVYQCAGRHFVCAVGLLI